MKKLITALVIVALLSTLVPATVYAATVTGQGKGGNSAPTVDALTFVEVGSDNPVSAFVPLTEYRLKASLGDINTIDDITDIEFHIYNVSDGTQSQSSNWNAAECAIFKWNDTTGWSMENNGGAATTTWVLESGDCIAPSPLTPTTGDWYLAFRPGELAQQDAGADWHAWVRVDDENKNDDNDTETLGSGCTMGAYGELTMDTATIAFAAVGLTPADGIEPGSVGYIATPTTYVTTQVGSNAIHDLGIASELTWDDSPDPNTITLSQTTATPPLTSGQFTLIIHDEEGANPGQPKFSTQGVTTANVTIAGHDVDARTPVADDAVEGTSDTPLYLALWFAADGVNEVTYSGDITFTLTV